MILCSIRAICGICVRYAVYFNAYGSCRPPCRPVPVLSFSPHLPSKTPRNIYISKEPNFWQAFSWAAYRAQLPPISGKRLCGPLPGRSYREAAGKPFCEPVTGRSYRQFSGKRFCGPPPARSSRQFSGKRFSGPLTRWSYC